jgi:membrane associated rhomboid family serine protease
MYGDTSIWQDITREFRNSIVSRLIIINVAIFLCLNIVYLVIRFSSPDIDTAADKMAEIMSWIILPGDPMTLLERPWTTITHMFTHLGIFHVLFNMLWFFWFGRILVEYVGSRKILPLYIYGGLTGMVLVVIAYSIFPTIVPTARGMGASAAVMAVVIATATLVPNYTVFLLFFGAVRIKYIALFLVILDLVSIPPNLSNGGHIAHLGGMLFGYIFIKQLQVGYDWSKPFNNALDWVTNLFSPGKRPRVVYKTESKKARKKPASASTSGDKQQQIDAILDKIARSGYDSLSKEEKEFLFKVSKDE